MKVFIFFFLLNCSLLVQLHLCEAIRLLKEPNNQVWLIGKKNNLKCLSNLESNQTCSWYKNGNFIGSSSFYNRECNYDKLTSHISNTGNYTCKIASNFSNTVPVLSCNFFDKPNFTIDILEGKICAKVLDDIFLKFSNKCLYSYLKGLDNEILEKSKGFFVANFSIPTDRTDFIVEFKFCDCNVEFNKSSISKKISVLESIPITATCQLDLDVLVTIKDISKLNETDQDFKFLIFLNGEKYIKKFSESNKIWILQSELMNKLQSFHSYNLTFSYQYFNETTNRTIGSGLSFAQFLCEVNYLKDIPSLLIDSVGSSNVSFCLQNSDGQLFRDLTLLVEVCLSSQSDIVYCDIRVANNLTFTNLKENTSYKFTSAFCKEKQYNNTCYSKSEIKKFKTKMIAKKNPEEKSGSIPIYIIISSGIILFFLIILMPLVYHLKRSVRTRLDFENVDNLGIDTLRSQPNCYYTPMSPHSPTKQSLMEDIKDRFSDKIINKSDIKVLAEIGQGQFGFVHEGILSIRDKGKIVKEQKVAVKFTLLNDFTLREKMEILKEAHRMKDLDHPNVMRLTGIYIPKFETVASFNPSVVLPYIENGDLKTYLMQKRLAFETADLTLNSLFNFCVDIANGMDYLAQHQIVHRDLAARNCMLDNNLNVIISDFGLSRPLYSSEYYRQQKVSKLPIKWMALESLVDNIFTFKTDVWGFGVTAWEIFTFGQQPYPGISNSELKGFLSRGMRLARPENCPNQLWSSVVYPCWQQQADDRSNFSEIIKDLQNIKSLLGEEVLEEAVKLVHLHSFASIDDNYLGDGYSSVNQYITPDTFIEQSLDFDYKEDIIEL